ncbi:hypothetical protein [Lentzea guizhouensis]|uniref:hypothetical protein n=1 Tax=Lentzea guizhouensis TaxID=1586287 RepID=UPI001F25ADAA|nr:hypothetical protein [Lentzea guizhouensis]
MRAPRAVVEGLLAAVVVGALVLLAVGLRDGESEGRLALLATPSTPDSAQFGEVTSLATPAVVQLVRSPSVLDAASRTAGLPADRLADAIAVELVPASGVARISVRAGSPEQAAKAVSAVAQAVIDADLLAPAARFRLVDPQPETASIARTRGWPPAWHWSPRWSRGRGGCGAPVARHRQRRAARADDRRCAAPGRDRARRGRRPDRTTDRAVRGGGPAGARAAGEPGARRTGRGAGTDVAGQGLRAR